MITKQIAGILYGYGYRLQDNEGNVWDITGLDPTRMALNFSRLVKFSEIGPTYKILAREMDLTKPIEGVGVPLIELASISGLGREWEIKENMLFKNGECFYLTKSLSWCLMNAKSKFTVYNQLALFNWLYTHHFNFFPEGTTTNLI